MSRSTCPKHIPADVDTRGSWAESNTIVSVFCVCIFSTRNGVGVDITAKNGVGVDISSTEWGKGGYQQHGMG